MKNLRFLIIATFATILCNACFANDILTDEVDEIIVVEPNIEDMKNSIDENDHESEAENSDFAEEQVEESLDSAGIISFRNSLEKRACLLIKRIYNTSKDMNALHLKLLGKHNYFLLQDAENHDVKMDDYERLFEFSVVGFINKIIFAVSEMTSESFYNVPPELIHFLLDIEDLDFSDCKFQDQTGLSKYEFAKSFHVMVMILKAFTFINDYEYNKYIKNWEKIADSLYELDESFISTECYRGQPIEKFRSVSSDYNQYFAYKVSPNILFLANIISLLRTDSLITGNLKNVKVMNMQ